MNTEPKMKGDGTAAAVSGNAAKTALAKAEGPTPKQMKWQHPKGTGKKPERRGGHAAAATCDGKCMVLFGGADREPKPYNVRCRPTAELAKRAVERK